MRTQRNTFHGIFYAGILLILILDTRTAINGAKDGIALCMQVLVPSLFPFFVLTPLVSSAFAGKNFTVLKPICRSCRIPENCGDLFILGLLCGYPVGAQNIYTRYKNGSLTKEDALRMLGFCNNAGPAFIFGVVGSLFPSSLVPWWIWIIHILSAWICGMILPGGTIHADGDHVENTLSISEALNGAIKAMVTVCGWVILFRILIFFCKRWFLWLLPSSLQAVLISIAELSNGFLEFSGISNDGVRFVLCAGALGFGGLCVGLQTISVTRELGTGSYFPGKILQTAISIAAAFLLQPALFHDKLRFFPTLIALGSVLTIVSVLYAGKKVVAFPKKLLYNTRNNG